MHLPKTAPHHNFKERNQLLLGEINSAQVQLFQAGQRLHLRSEYEKTAWALQSSPSDLWVQWRGWQIDRSRSSSWQVNQLSACHVMRCNFSQLWALVYLVSSLFSARAWKRLRTAGGSTTVQERVNSESLPQREANLLQPLSPGLTWEVCQRKKGSLWLSQYCDQHPDIWEKQLGDRRLFKFCQLPASKCMIPPKKHCTLSSQQMSKEGKKYSKNKFKIFCLHS